MTLGDYSPERIADRLQIQDVMYRWCRAIDRRDYEAIREGFFPDATDDHGLFQGGIDGLVAWMRERHANIPFCVHAVSNILIEFVGPDVAIVETYISTAQHYPAKPGEVAQVPFAGDKRSGVPMNMLAYARYADRFERREGQWRIAKRITIFDTSMVFEATSDPGAMPPAFKVSQRDQDDVIYQLRSEAGLQR